MLKSYSRKLETIRTMSLTSTLANQTSKHHRPASVTKHVKPLNGYTINKMKKTGSRNETLRKTLENIKEETAN